MGIDKLELDKYNGDKGIVLGGSPLIEAVSDWPDIPGTTSKQTLLFTIFPEHFKIPTLSADNCLSVFISFDKNRNYADEFAYHSKADVRKNQEYTTVLLHKRAQQRLTDPSLNYTELPMFSVVERPFSQVEFDADTRGLTKGSELSKSGGQPGWLQDMVFIGPQYFFELQLNEFDLRKKAGAYDDIFNDGIGFLFLNHNIKKFVPPKQAGVFFIQYT